MTTQTSIPSEMLSGIPGMLADTSMFKDVDSATNTDSTSIAPGTFIIVDPTSTATKNTGAKNCGTIYDRLKGLAIFGHSYSPVVQLDASGNYLPNITFDYLRHGRAFALAGAAITETDEVHVQMVADTGYPVGCIRPDNDTSKTIDVSAFVSVVQAGDATNAPIIEIDMTNVALTVVDAT